MKVLYKYVLISFLILGTFAAKAQQLNPLYDMQRIHFGFSIIGNTGKLKYSTSEGMLDLDTLQSIRTLSFPGFGVGGIINVRMFEYWDFRTMVNIQFVERHLEYNFRGDDNKQTAKINSTYLEIPMLLKYKSKRHRDTRLYLLGGATYRYDFNSDIDTERSNTKPIVALQPSTFSYDVGVGFDFYYEFFKFSPEIRLSNGIGNQMVQDPFIFSSSLQRMSPKLLQFIFHFEG